MDGRCSVCSASFYGALKTHSKLDLRLWVIRLCQIRSIIILEALTSGETQHCPDPDPTSPVTRPSYLLPRHVSTRRVRPPVRPSVGRSVRLCKKKERSAVCIWSCSLLPRRRPARRQLTRPPPPFAMAIKWGDIAILFPIRECFTISQLSRPLRHYTHHTSLPLLQILSRATAGAGIFSIFSFGGLDRHHPLLCDHLGLGRGSARVLKVTLIMF